MQYFSLTGLPLAGMTYVESKVGAEMPLRLIVMAIMML